MICYFEITRYFFVPNETFCQTVFQGQACSTSWKLSSFKVSQGSQDSSLISKVFISIIAFTVTWFPVFGPDMFSYHHVGHLCLFGSCALAQKMLKHTAVPTTCTQIKQIRSWFSRCRAWLDPAHAGHVVCGSSTRNVWRKGGKVTLWFPWGVQEVHKWTQPCQGTFAEQTQAWFSNKLTDKGRQALVKKQSVMVLIYSFGNRAWNQMAIQDKWGHFYLEWAGRTQVGHLAKLATILHYYTV